MQMEGKQMCEKYSYKQIKLHECRKLCTIIQIKDLKVARGSHQVVMIIYEKWRLVYLKY
jgi:hypothetical protein